VVEHLIYAYFLSCWYTDQLCMFSIDLEWLCLGNPNAHHDVMPCAPEKIPEFLLQVFCYLYDEVINCFWFNITKLLKLQWIWSKNV